jgi:hypothetical protein
MRYANRLRLVGTAAALGALLSTGCQSRPTPNPKPVPQATSLFMRNYTAFDVIVSAVPKPDGTPVWLTNVPAGSTRTVALKWSDLQANGGLVIRTQLLGSSRTWTSAPLIVDEGIVGVLDLRTNNSLATTGSVLRGVTTQAFDAAMR